MKSGGGKRKGAAKERDFSKVLSLWITKGANENVFWRSAISGGRATVAKKSGVVNAAQAGDICAVSPEGFKFAANFYVELKHYKTLGLERFLLGLPCTISKFWDVAVMESSFYKKQPLLVARQNRLPDFILFTEETMKSPLLKVVGPTGPLHLVTLGNSTDSVIMLMRLEDFLTTYEFNHAC